MTAKEYLQQIYHFHCKIKRLQGRRDKLRADLYSLGSPAGKMDVDKVQTSMSGDAMLRLIAKVDEIERDIVYEIDQMVDASERIAGEIEQVSNEHYRDILHKRYIEFKKWMEIAEEMHMEISWVFRLHGRALQYFEANIMNKQ